LKVSDSGYENVWPCHILNLVIVIIELLRWYNEK